jgi:inosose dehydratase
MITRREFIIGSGAAAFASVVRADAGAIRFGYAAITWGGRDLDAIEDIAAAGYPGIQLRATILRDFASRPAALRDELARRKLTFVALSSGNLRIDNAREDLTAHTANAKFLRDAGGLFLQVIDERPKDRQVTSADCVRLGRLLTELGTRTADVGIPLAYHHHMNSIGQPPDAIARILDATDPKYVKLLLDVAHYQQGGGDPVQAVRQYADRIGLMHIKDVESTSLAGRAGEAPPALPARGYRFVELGRGTVDLKGVFAALAAVNYRGWAVVELDAVPDNARTPKEAAVANRRYLEETIGLSVAPGRPGGAGYLTYLAHPTHLTPSSR